MYLLKLCFLFHFLSYTCSAYYYTQIGEFCHINNFVGTCKRVPDCPVAFSFLNNNDSIPHCFFQDGINPVVCCPSNPLSVMTGPHDMVKIFRDSRIIKTDELTCYFEDQEPFLCCENPPENPPEMEPKDCPPLPRPELDTPVRHPAWDKCLSYQQYFNVCVEIGETETQYIRNDTCKSLDGSQTRIIAAYNAAPRQFPHMAVIGSADTHESTDIKWFGGGALISDKFILTAAHVVIETKGGLARYALLGAVNKKDVKGGVLCNIVKRHGYKFYEGIKKDHDIALVELLHRVQFNEFIRPACLPVPGSKLKEGFLVAGWGKTEKEDNSTVLLYTIVRENDVNCVNKLGSAFNSETMICGQSGVLNKADADACTGDSGGPLMAEYQNLNRSYSVEGVVSFGPSCGKGAGVYTRVSYYMDFIMETVWPDDWSVFKQKMKEVKEQNEKKQSMK